MIAWTSVLWRIVSEKMAKKGRKLPILSRKFLESPSTSLTFYWYVTCKNYADGKEGNWIFNDYYQLSRYTKFNEDTKKSQISLLIF